MNLQAVVGGRCRKVSVRIKSMERRRVGTKILAVVERSNDTAIQASQMIWVKVKRNVMY